MTPTRTRIALGGMAAVLIAFCTALFLHECTHELQNIVRGYGWKPMHFNPLLLTSICGGKYACVDMGANTTGNTFLGGEGIAVLVHMIAFPLVFTFLLPRLIGLRSPRAAPTKTTDTTIVAALRA